MPPTLKSVADLETWEAKKGFKGVITHGGFTIQRKCEKCDQPTLSLAEKHCPKHGGKRQVRNECQTKGCKKKATQANGTMCQGCWIAADPAARGCPGCQSQPKRQSRPDGLCANCVGKAGVKAKREARRAELAQLCEDEEHRGRTRRRRPTPPLARATPCSTRRTITSRA